MDKLKEQIKQLSINSRVIDWSVIAVVIFFVISFGSQYISSLDSQLSVKNNIEIVKTQNDIKKKMVSDTLNQKITALKTSADTLNDNSYSSLSYTLSFMSHQMETWGFDRMAVVDRNGYWNYQNGESESQDTDVIDDLSDYMMTAPIEVNNQYYIEIYVPLDTVLGGKRMIALVGYYSVNQIIDQLKNDLYEDSSHMKLIDYDGNVLIQSDGIGQKENILETVKNGKLENKTYDDILSDFDKKEEGYVKFVDEKQESYIYYSSLDVNSWYLTTVVPASVVEVGSINILSNIMTICIVIIVIAAACLVAGMLLYIFNNRHLEKLAYEDEVTQGNNRAHFEKKALKLMKNSTYNYAIVYVNVEKFKVLNEHFGQKYANEILKNVYDIIMEQLDSQEICARLVSDNYALLVHYESKNELIQRLDSIRQKCKDIMKKDGYIYQLQLTFGIYAVHERSIDINHFIDCAYLANKNIEARYKDYYNFYDDKMQNVLLNEQKLEDKMQSALDNGNIRVYFEPKYNTRYGQIEGAEAIVRWIDAEQGIIHSNEFIPLFEKTGMVVKLDVYVFEKVCILLRKWIDMGIDVVPISVNISMENLYVYDFLDEYEKILKKYSIPGKLIEFEFKEVLMYENTDVLKGIIQRIHQMGCYCSMDEFGSGYTALNSIKQIYVDILKIDKSFFHDERDKERNKEVIQGVVYLAKRLNLTTVAIGVEKQEDLDFLRSIGVDYVQGRILSETLAAIDFEKKINQSMN